MFIIFICIIIFVCKILFLYIEHLAKTGDFLFCSTRSIFSEIESSQLLLFVFSLCLWSIKWDYTYNRECGTAFCVDNRER